MGVNGEIKRIIDSFNQGDDPEIGMGLGSETTQLIQLAVLDDFDHFYKKSNFTLSTMSGTTMISLSSMRTRLICRSV